MTDAAKKSLHKLVRVADAFAEYAPPGSLYGLTATYLHAQTALLDLNLDEQTVKDTLEGLEGDVAAKALRVVAMAQNFEAFAKAIKERALAMQARAKHADDRACALRLYALNSLRASGFAAGDRIESPDIEIRLQNNPPRVVIEDEKLVPGFYWRTPDQPADVIDKAAILADLKAPDEAGNPRHVPGCRLVQEVRMVEK